MSDRSRRTLPPADLAATLRQEGADPAPPIDPTATPSGRLVLWTPVTVRARMQGVQSERGTLYRDQVLDAIEETVDRLPRLIAAAVGGETAVRGRLFERRPPQRRPQAERRVQLTIGGFLPSQLTIIDELVVSTGAASRSALVNAALDAALPPL